MPVMPATDEWSYVSPGTVASQADVDAPGSTWSLGEEMWSDLDVVRMFVQDTNPAVRLLPDVEVQYLIDTWMPKVPSLVYVAHKAAEQIAAKFTGVVSVNADGVNVAIADLAPRYEALAKRLLQTHKDHEIGGEVDIRNLMWGATRDYGIAPLVFGVGQHDNREAGRQEYGGRDFGHTGYGNELAPGGW